MSLGAKLKEARIEKGYTLNTMQQMTKIQKKYLQAIEDDRYDEMPGDFYVQAFIKQYADVVGLDADELLEEYREELDLTKDTYIQEYKSEQQEELPSRLSRNQSDVKSKLDIALSYLPLMLLIGLVIMIMITLIYAINSIGQKSQVAEVVSSESQSIVSVVEPTSTSVVEEKEEKEEESTPVELGENQQRIRDAVLTLVSAEGEPPVYEVDGNLSDLDFILKGQAFVWFGLFEDDMMVADETLAADEEYTYEPSEGTEELRIGVGYPEGVQVSINGVKVKLPADTYFETITFIQVGNHPSQRRRTNEETEEGETLEEETPEEETTTTDGYEGPAVYNPDNNEE